MLATTIRVSKPTYLALTSLLLILCAIGVRAQPTPASASRIYAQKLVEETLAVHPELMGLELAATPPGKTQCVTIASNETKSIGEKCDKDESVYNELRPIKTLRKQREIPTPSSRTNFSSTYGKRPQTSGPRFD